MAERNLGSLSGSGVVFDTLGPGDTLDTFEFALSADANITWTSFLVDFPTSTFTFSGAYSAGTNGIAWGQTYSTTLQYGFRYSVTFTAANPEQHRQEFIDDTKADAFGMLSDIVGAAIDLGEIAATFDDAKALFKGVAAKWGYVGTAVNVTNRADSIQASSDPARQAFIELIDFHVELGAAAGGGALGTILSGNPVVGVLAGLGSGYVYSELLSESIREFAGAAWDAAKQLGPDDDPTAALAAMLESFAGDVIEFDAAWYLGTYGDAAAAVASGLYPSAYAHYVNEGVGLGYSPNSSMVLLTPADIAHADPSEIAASVFRPDVYDAAVGLLAGDDLSNSESQLVDAINSTRTLNSLATVTASVELTAVANRFAVDLVHNFGGNAFEMQFTSVGFGDNWSDLFDFATGASAFTPGYVVVELSNISTGKDALAAAAALLGSPAIVDAGYNAVGVGEYGGVWIVVLGSTLDPITTAPNSGSASTIDRRGNEQAEVLALGTWTGSIAGAGGDDLIFGNADNIASLLEGDDGDDIIKSFGGDDSSYGGAGADTISGGAGGDLLSGDGESDLVDGEAGDDTLDGGAGDDTIIGGAGADAQSGGAGFDSASYATSFSAIRLSLTDPLLNVGDAIGDTFDGSIEAIVGSSHDDTLEGDALKNLLLGAAGADLIAGLSGADSLDGEDGLDTVFGGDGADILRGGGGDDAVDGGAGNDFVDGGDGNDLITAQSGRDTILGGIGNDSVDAAAGDDVIDGGADQDRLFGGAGNDSLIGGNDKDTLQGGTENDTLVGGKGFDFLLGQDGNDSLDGGAIADTLLGGAGVDTLRGGADNDRLLGEAQRDQIFGDDGDDIVDAGTGDDNVDGGGQKDRIFGGSGFDSLIGGGGNDTLQGGNDNDTLQGGAGFDVLEGGAGDDSLDGGDSNDFIFGNAGDDTIIFSLGGDIDTLRDFTAGAATDDVIRLVGFGAAFDSFAEVLASATDDGVSTTINFGGGDMLIIKNVLVSQLDASDFEFG